MCVISIFEYKIQAKYLSSCSNTLYRESLGLTPLPSALYTSLYFLSSCCNAKYSQNRMCSQKALTSGSMQRLDQCGYCVLGKYLRSLSFVLYWWKMYRPAVDCGSFSGGTSTAAGWVLIHSKKIDSNHSITILMYPDATLSYICCTILNNFFFQASFCL